VICSRCQGKLRVSHTYSQQGAKFQRAVCELCGQVHCVTSFIRIEPVTRVGQGAEGRATNLRNGVPLEDVLGLTTIRRPRARRSPAASLERPGPGAPDAPAPACREGAF
jgi:hypothetical protein